jgi:uncharacterized NAD(P)/FAD-binding protein YdhS
VTLVTRSKRSPPVVAICGNGASAVALLHALAASALIPLTIVVIGTGEPGAGLAYATRNASHLLNTPAGRMSVHPDEPDQFVQWLRKRDLWTPGWNNQFVPRQHYGRYLRDAAAMATLVPGLTVRFLQGQVISLTRNRAAWRVAHDNGQIDADFVVLATGNDMPSPLAPRLAPALRGLVADNPWDLPPTRPDERILVLGTGLTAVDTILSLADRGHQGELTMLSRHGMLPHTHARPQSFPPLAEPHPRTVRGLLRALRVAAGPSRDDAHWQGVMEAMRPHWHEAWQSLPPAEQRRFLRHGATIWNMHRHRLAPQVAQRLHQALNRNGRLLKGRIVGMEAGRDGAAMIRIASRGTQVTIAADRIVNCMGPNSDPEKSHNPLIENIVASLQARTAPCGIGLDVTSDDRVIAYDGLAHASLYAMGALTRGRWWEITALPEIVLQARDIARRLQARALAGTRNP